MANLDTEQKPILCEYLSHIQSNLMTEAEDYVDKDGNHQKHWYFKGIFIQGEKRNLNGRVYPHEEIENAVDELDRQISETGGVLGELDHPDTLVINAQNASHLITEMKMVGDNGTGKMRILTNVPAGKIVEGLMLDKVPLGVSSRGSGDVDDWSQTVSNFHIVTVDIVATPSAQDARPTAVYEHLRNGAGQHLLNNAKDLITGNSKRLEKQLNDDIVSWFRTWSYK